MHLNTANTIEAQLIYGSNQFMLIGHDRDLVGYGDKDDAIVGMSVTSAIQ